MQIEAATIPKYRSGTQLGDDVILILPGAVFGVFDGATDARGTVVDGVPAGRFAALTVAGATARVMQDADARRADISTVLGHLSKALADHSADGFTIPPSTTLALALDCGADWRFVILGDSGIRLNGSEVLQPTKLIDTVSTRARVALFTHFRGNTATLDAAEMATRRAIFLGLDHAVDDAQIPASLATTIIDHTVQTCGLGHDAGLVEQFLRGGICTQHRFANAPGTIFGFDTMNGTALCLGQWVDQTWPKAAVTSIELFTDGYPAPAQDVSLTSWEAAFTAAETTDFHMTGPHATVKGATTTEHYDDRSVIVLSGPLA